MIGPHDWQGGDTALDRARTGTEVHHERDRTDLGLVLGQFGLAHDGPPCPFGRGLAPCRRPANHGGQSFGPIIAVCQRSCTGLGASQPVSQESFLMSDTPETLTLTLAT